MNKLLLLASFMIVGFVLDANAQKVDISVKIDNKEFNPATLLWYEGPAKEWEEALPVGNGRLGAMVFGKYWEEQFRLMKKRIGLVSHIRGW